MNLNYDVPDPYAMRLEDIDVSNPDLYKFDAWRPYFDRLRKEDPVHYRVESPFGPFWSITRFEDIVEIDSNYKDFSSEPAIVIGDLIDELPIEMFIAMDPPKHDMQRKAAQPVVAPQNLVAMEALIRSRVVEILDGLPIGETFDWVDKVSIELTAQMLATLFDFPIEECRKLTYWSDLAAGSPEVAGGSVDQSERIAGLTDCLHTFMAIWNVRKSEDRSQRAGVLDLIRLLQEDPHTEDLVDRPMEFLGNLILLIVGGNDTTRNSISGGVLALNQNPKEYEKLRNNPELIPNMVSEIIRWQTPLMHMRRTATRDVEFKGKLIRKGEKVVMWYLSGNHDESAIKNANEFLIDMPNARHHVSFGFGVHRCMGNRLAEMQLTILWEEITRRFRLVEVVEDPERVQSNFVRGYEKLLVKLHLA